MKNFIQQIPIFAIKGFVIFLGFMLIVTVADKLDITFYMNHMYPTIQQIGMIGKIIGLIIIGIVAQYTFWK